MSNWQTMTLHMELVLNVETDRYASYEEMRDRIRDDFCIEQLIVDDDLCLTLVEELIVKAV